jgi:hypothetical protein
MPKKLVTISIRGRSGLLVDNMVRRSDQDHDIVHCFASPEAAVDQKRFLDESGADCVPAIWFHRAMVDAARLGAVQVTPVRESVLVRGELVPISYAERSAKHFWFPLPGSRKKGVIAIPMYRGWSAELVVEYDEGEIAPHGILALLIFAGKRVGIGRFRPQKQGPYGTFGADVSAVRAA